MNGSWQPNGQTASRNGQPQDNVPRPRMPIVQEALPYTPLSSIIPFSPNVIPPPLALPTDAPSLFTNLNEAQTGRDLLQRLSSGATSAEIASKQCRQTLDDVQRLLDPGTLTDYHFKSRKNFLAPPANGTRPALKLSTAKLTPFAKMALDQADIPFRYLTPESPELKPAKPAATPIPALQPQQVLQNGYQTAPSSQQRTTHAVVVPNSITPVERAQYQYIPASDAASGAHSSSANRVSISQQQKGDQAVQNLQNLLGEIFQAEDALEPDTSGAISTIAAEFFTASDVDGCPTPFLQHPIQIKLVSAVQKAAVCGRLDNLEVEHLSRVQRLCERPMAALDSLSLSVGDEWSDQDVEEWLSRLKSACSGLAAMRTLMFIMAELAHNKELQSEDYLRVILDGLKAVVEDFITGVVQEPAALRERIRGEKEAPPVNPKFVVLSGNSEEVRSVLTAATKSMRALGDLLVKTELDETAISSVEALCKSVIFAENASTEKDSAIGIQRFEELRRCAMDVLAKVFTKYDNQRRYIFDEILMSLERLPATKQSARQYRPTDAKPIQLLSALLMRLIQTSATKSSEALKLRTTNPRDEADSEEESASEQESDEEGSDEITVSRKKHTGGSGSLLSITAPLHEAAQRNASYVVNMLIQRALSTSKSSEEPYRKLLDIFTADFLNCLGLPDWPAAELLLRTLTMRMIGIINEESSTAPQRTFALELLGNMGSGILELQIAARNAASAADVNESPAVPPLRDMVAQLETAGLDSSSALSYHGPHHIVVQYIDERSANKNDAQLITAKGYHLMQWAHLLVGGREGSAESESNLASHESRDLRSKLRKMLTDPHLSEDDQGTYHMTTPTSKLAAMVITLNSAFCRAFNKMFYILLTAMSSEQSSSTVKSRSLKSIVTLLEKDATLLERNASVFQHIVRCVGDNSPLVRDSALSLIEKCISLRPALGSNVVSTIILRTRDGAIGVRKRAMKMLKEIYLRNESTNVRSAIANAIIARIEDAEESVVEIARTTMEEIWFHSLYAMKMEGEGAIKAKLAYTAHAALFIKTVEYDDNALSILEALLKRLLTRSKLAEANGRVCRTLIAVLFDGIIDTSDIPGSPSQSGILRSLTVFARASPQLFTSTQLQRLEPYTQNLNSSDDLDVYRSVVIILRYVLPHRSVMNRDVLTQLHRTLLKSVTKLQKAELNEAVPCLWTISGLIGETHLIANFVISVLEKIASVSIAELATDEKKATTVFRLARIAGEFGNACDLDSFLADFTKKFVKYKGHSVADLMVETLCPFTSPKCPLVVREVALEAICSVAQAWPKLFTRKDIENAFDTVFREHLPELEKVLLDGLEAFFVAQETPEPGEDGHELGTGVASGSDRLSKTYVASDQDGAAIAMAQRFISQIISIAVSSRAEQAFVAARLVVSINKQGMVHPKDSVPVLVALETCPDKDVSNAAFKEHKSQHAKHESIYDKEYMRAVQRTFEYQQKVIGDAAGFQGSPSTAKMHMTWEVLKGAKATVRRKFLTNMAQKLDFDPTKAALAQHLGFARFCLQNLAFFEYDRVDDLLPLLAALDKLFAGTGSTVAQAIESEVLKMGVEGLTVPGSQPNGTSDAMPPTMAVDLDPQRLHQLAVSSQILTLAHETRSFLIRIWNMQKHLTKTKQQKDKDTNKAPTRSTSAPTFTDAFIRRVADVGRPLSTEDECHAMCSAFAELHSVDNEVKAASEGEADDAELANGYDTPSDRSKKSPSLPPASGGGKGRKRKLSNAGTTPRKRGRPSMGGKRKSGSARVGDDEDAGWD
ncbi:Sister chromatid cohesion protein 2 [Saxophila tyrrhenica]|uniref:Sister chromatid cohesion protein n=1 Tax=Saxophila tyrrhenica TaxID=1690608 RepID=A0AAV9P268_9PEZI|nr:Sister chromatid cohesion protein 2 [Saxophila tyrrhenica]